MVLDDFAGPGGWSLALHALGLRELGVEWDPSACATRRAARLPTLQADVAAVTPEDVGPVWGYIGSPPCPAFSMAGLGVGRDALPALVDAVRRVVRGEHVSEAELDEVCADRTAHLVLEPMRRVVALRPRWVALEQVRPVLPLWEAAAEEMRALGYSTWTGVLTSEQYGVPQTRQRAILVASLDLLGAGS